ncbi:Protein kinase domain-containing protein [Aphelenchoides fujianensis]|nr:Protein kinase domain-containing protein [Aphelenchoides fujianensis]
MSDHSFFSVNLHQRILEFEGRIRKWSRIRLFSRRSSSVSRTPNPEAAARQQLRTRPGCFTAPIPRRNMNLSGRPRPGGLLDSVSTERRVPDSDVAERYKLIEESSGRLSIGGKFYENIKIDQLQRQADLGSGTCGTVSKYVIEGKAMAVKEMKRTDNKEESKRIFMDLHVIRQSNDCQNIVKCFGYIITQDHLYICMELMASCAEKLLVERQLIGFPEEIIGKIACSVIDALNYLKIEHCLMHRDVKPSNILLNIRGQIKLCDFGISGQLIDSQASTMSTGCTAYLAVARAHRPPPLTTSVPVNVWSLGLSLMQLARGSPPYAEELAATNMTPFALMIRIQTGEPPTISESEGFSAEFCQFVAQCLQKRIEQRPKYEVLMTLPYYVNAKQSPTDVGHWLANPQLYKPPGPPPPTL